MAYATGKGRLKDERRGCELFSQACELGDVKGCYNFGYCLQEGLGGMRDQPRARKVYADACNRDFALACNNLGIMRTRAQGGPREEKAAFDAFERGCQLGSADSCSSVGKRFVLGEVVPRNLSRAVSFYVLACTLGDPVGCRTAIPNLREMGDAESLRKAFEIASTHCSAGDAETCTELAHLYAYGEGVAADAKHALRFYGRGCEGGDARGCMNVAYRLESPEPDLARAAYQAACDLGEKEGCLRVARALLYSDEPGSEQALATLKSSCDAWEENGLGCVILGEMYRTGHGTPRDHVKAQATYERACERGSNRACGALGAMLLAAKEDLERARKQLGRACTTGVPGYCYMYGVTLEYGLGGSKELRGAYDAYVRGCHDHGHTACRAAANMVVKEFREPKDVKVAVEAFEARCRQLGGDGCAELAFLATKNLGPQYSVDETLARLEQSCELRSGRGCTLLGYALWRDMPNLRDVDRAREVFRKACSLEDREGCHMLAMLHDPTSPQHVAVDEKLAMDGYRRACDAEFAEACEALGTIFAEGRLGQPKDPAAAKPFFDRACKLGLTKACAAR